MATDLQTQIAIVAGVLGGVCLILLIALIILFAMLKSMKKKLKMQANIRQTVIVQESRQDDDTSSRFSQYPPVAMHPKMAPLPPAHSMNPSPYQASSVGGYEAGARYAQPQRATAQNERYQRGQTNPAYESSRPRGTGSNYGY